MKKIQLIPLLILLLSLTGCELVGDIFQAGVWAGVLLVVGIIALVIFLFAKMFGR